MKYRTTSAEQCRTPCCLRTIEVLSQIHKRGKAAENTFFEFVGQALAADQASEKQRRFQDVGRDLDAIFRGGSA